MGKKAIITKIGPEEFARARFKLAQAVEDEQTIIDTVAWINAIESPMNTGELLEDLPPAQVLMGRLLSIRRRLQRMITKSLIMPEE
jgi:hypothetical protein